MKYFQFNCGCRIEIIQDSPMRLNLDIENVKLDCQKTWDMICDGNTKGVFQVENRQAANAKKLAPRTIEEFADLTAIIRPGCTEALMDDGKSLTHHFMERKHGREEVTYIHPLLEPILSPTYGILVYQEQAIKIVQAIAGFNAQEADILRKACGKKDTETMSKVLRQITEKGRALGLATDAELEEIVRWIQATQRYSFNKSHAVLYAINGYWSAYCKAHFIRPFFTSWLGWAHKSIDSLHEVNELVNNAKLMDVSVNVPDFRRMNAGFSLIEKKIYFGITDIKGIGEAVYHKMMEHVLLAEEKTGRRDNWSWATFLLHYSQGPPSPSIRALISSGGLDYMGVGRTRMMYEFELYSKLTDKEQLWCLAHHNEQSSLEDILRMMLRDKPGRGKSTSNKKRYEFVEGLLKILENPPHKLDDSPEWIAAMEEFLLGISLTCSRVDGCDKDAATCNCREFLNSEKRYVLIAVEVNKAKEHTITKQGDNEGKKMCFLTLSDSTCSIEGVAFHEAWKEYKGLLTVGNTVMVAAERSQKDKNSLQVKKVWQI